MSWRSSLQSIVALSSTESEYIALAEMVREQRAQREVLKWLMPQLGAMVVQEDNQACIMLANNTEGTRRSKHIDVRHHVCKEAIEGKEIDLVYVPTGEQIADMLTKCLPRILHERHRASLLDARRGDE